MIGDELTIEQRIDRGRRASTMLEDPVLVDAFEHAREQFTAEWLSTDDARKQLAAWAKVHALDAVRDDLRRTVSDGQIAAEGLNRLK